MKNKFFVLGVIAVLILPAGLVWAQSMGDLPSDGSLVEVGNTICPVSGAKIGSMGEGLKHEYKGKIYNLCCPACIKDFEADPEKYSKIAEAQAHEAMMKNQPMEHEHQMEPVMNQDGEVSYYTCGMHPSVRVSVENYEKGDTKCPICFMPLTPVKKNEKMGGQLGEDVMSQVDIQAKELKLAGVKTEPAQKRELYKEIRAVGKVAYDPQMAVAQDEFISAMKSFRKATQGKNTEIIERAQSLIDSSKRKLRLLGLNEGQIAELEKTQKVQQNLVLPEEKMWIYGDVYEYELNWIHEGAYVKVKSIGLPGEEFYGEIVSINPVVDSQTRSVRFRALVNNPGHKLKPEMYVDIEILSQYSDPEGKTEVLTIPKSALLNTGRRTIVWVDKGQGDFEGRKVEVGPEAIDHSSNPRKFYPVLKGIEEGEQVVTKGNFLIDSQSQITGVASTAYGGALGEESVQDSPGEMSGHVH